MDNRVPARAFRAGCAWPLLSFLLAAAVNAGEGSEALRLLGSGWVMDAPTKVAQELDYFNRDDAGMALTPPVAVAYANSGKEALARLRAGEAAFALAAPAPVARALLESPRTGNHGGVDIAILASVGLSSRGHYILADRLKGVSEPVDLAGKRVGVMFETSAHFGWSRFARYHGLNDADVVLVDTPIDRQLPMLAKGDLDAVVTWDPWGEQMLAELDGRLAAFSMRPLYSVNWLLLTRREIIDRHPAVTERVLDGYRRAIDFIAAHPERARRIHAVQSGVDATELKALEAGVIWRLGLDWSVLVNMEARFDWLAPTLSPPPPSRYLAAGFLGCAAPTRLALPDFLTQSPAPQVQP